MTIVMQKPTFPPYVCVDCGMQDGRLWFVDMQINLDNYFNPVMNGTIYLCNECFDARVIDTTKQVQALIGNYDGMVPTYDNKEDLLEKVNLDDGNLQSEPTWESPTGISLSEPVPAGDDGGTVLDQIPTGIDFGTTNVDQSDGDVDSGLKSDDSNDEDKSLSGFRGFFGNSSGW